MGDQRAVQMQTAWKIQLLYFEVVIEFICIFRVLPFYIGEPKIQNQWALLKDVIDERG